MDFLNISAKLTPLPEAGAGDRSLARLPGLYASGRSRRSIGRPSPWIGKRHRCRGGTGPASGASGCARVRERRSGPCRHNAGPLTGSVHRRRTRRCTANGRSSAGGGPANARTSPGRRTPNRSNGPVERRPDPQLVRFGAEIVPHLVHLDHDGALGYWFRTKCLDVVGHPADHRVGAGRQQLGDTPEGQPVSVQGDGRPLRSIIGPRGGRQAGELISATPAQPSLLAVMVARLDDPDAVAARAVRLGQHGQSDSSVNPPPYLGFVVPPEHPPSCTYTEQYALPCRSIWMSWYVVFSSVLYIDMFVRAIECLLHGRGQKPRQSFICNRYRCSGRVADWLGSL